MAVYEIDVCNVAISYAGVQRAFIDKVSTNLYGLISHATAKDQSYEAQLCALNWIPARKETLKEYRWPWATARKALANKTAVTAGQGNPWLYKYDLPYGWVAGDFIDMTEIIDGAKVRHAYKGIDFRLENDGSGAIKIFTDWDNAGAVFTFDNYNALDMHETAGNPDHDTGDLSLFWDPLFIDALAWRLACKIALPISGDPNALLFCEQGYMEAITLAKANIARWGISPPPPPEAEYALERQVAQQTKDKTDRPPIPGL